MNSKVPVRINFQNVTPDKVEMMWTNQATQEKVGYGFIEPNGANFNLETHEDHEWSFINTQTGECVTVNNNQSYIVSADHDGQTIVIGDQTQMRHIQKTTIQQQTVDVSVIQQPMIPFGGDPGGFDTGLTQQMFIVTTTVKTVTIVQEFGFSPIYQPVAVNPEALQRYILHKHDEDGEYEGPYDEQGNRSGVGICKWPDGSMYEGDWLNNVRHGNGKYVCGSHEYVGEWQDDMKHGRGKYTRKDDGTKCEEEDLIPIYAPFEKDQLNGLGTQGDKTVLFKNGMKVNLSGKECNACRCITILLTLLVHPLFWGSLYVSFLVEQPVVFVGFAVCIGYCFHVAKDPATQYMDNIQTSQEIFDNISKAIESRPQISISYECYHYEQFTSYENGKAVTRSRKLVTASGKEEFEFEDWVDKSAPASTIDYLQKLTLCRLKIDEIVQMSPSVRMRYEQKKQEVIDENEELDQCFTWQTTIDIPFTEEHTLVYTGEEGDEPWYTWGGLMIWLDFCILGWISRLTLLSKTYEVNYSIVKYLIK